MDPEVIAAIAAGIATLAPVLGGILLKRQEIRTQHVENDVADLETDLADLGSRFDAALRHIYQLRALMSAHELDVPDLPDDLTARRNRRGAA